MEASVIEALASSASRAVERGEPRAGEAAALDAVSAADALREGPERDRSLVIALRASGTVYRALGRYDDAAAAFGRALEALRRLPVGALADADIGETELLDDLGVTWKSAGRFAEAEEAYRDAIALVDAHAEPDLDDLASLHHNLAGLAHARGDFATAEPLARRSVELRAAALGPDDPSTLLDRSALAAILHGQGRTTEAEATIREILPGLTEALGGDHPELAVALNNLAALVQARGDLEEAERLYRRVLAIRERRLGPEAPALAVPLSNLGTVLRRLGRPTEAVALYERALVLLEPAVDRSHPNLAAIRRNLERARDDLESTRAVPPTRR